MTAQIRVFGTGVNFISSNPGINAWIRMISLGASVFPWFADVYDIVNKQANQLREEYAPYQYILAANLSSGDQKLVYNEYYE